MVRRPHAPRANPDRGWALRAESSNRLIAAGTDRCPDLPGAGGRAVTPGRATRADGGEAVHLVIGDGVRPRGIGPGCCLSMKGEHLPRCRRCRWAIRSPRKSVEPESILRSLRTMNSSGDGASPSPAATARVASVRVAPCAFLSIKVGACDPPRAPLRAVWRVQDLDRAASPAHLLGVRLQPRIPVGDQPCRLRRHVD